MLAKWSMASNTLLIDISCARPTNDILIEFEIEWNFVNAVVIFSQSQQNVAHVTTVTLSWRMQNSVVIVWFETRALRILYRITNLIEIPLAGRAPDLETANGRRCEVNARKSMSLRVVEVQSKFERSILKHAIWTVEREIFFITKQ